MDAFKALFVYVVTCVCIACVSLTVSAQDEHRSPDAQRTPGHATYVTYTAATVCAIKSSKDERNVPDSVKEEVYADYGAGKCADYCSGPQGCKIDRLARPSTDRPAGSDGRLSR